MFAAAVSLDMALQVLEEWKRRNLAEGELVAHYEAASITEYDLHLHLYQRGRTRAVNKPSRSFTLPGEGPYQGLLLIESAYWRFQN